MSDLDDEDDAVERDHASGRNTPNAGLIAGGGIAAAVAAAVLGVRASDAGQPLRVAAGPEPAEAAAPADDALPDSHARSTPAEPATPVAATQPPPNTMLTGHAPGQRPPVFAGQVNPDGSLTLISPSGGVIGRGTLSDGERLLLAEYDDGRTHTTDLRGLTFEATTGNTTTAFTMSPSGAAQFLSRTTLSDGTLKLVTAAGMMGIPAGAVLLINQNGQLFLNNVPIGQATTLLAMLTQHPPLATTAQTITHFVTVDPMLHLSDGSTMSLNDYLNLLKQDANSPKLAADLALFQPGGTDPTLQLSDGSQIRLSQYIASLQDPQATFDFPDGPVTLDVRQALQAMAVTTEDLISLGNMLPVRADSVISAGNDLAANLADMDVILRSVQSYADGYLDDKMPAIIKGMKDMLAFLGASGPLPQSLYSLGSGLVQAAIAIEDGERQLAAQFPGTGITPPGHPGGRRPNYS